MSLPTPPHYVVLPSEVIDQAYAPDKPRRALLASFTRILSLAWESKYEKTPRMLEEELMEFLKLSRRQYFEQKADMELLGWLRSSHPVPGFVQFSFSRSIVASVSTNQASQVPNTPNAENRTPMQKIALASELIGVEESLIKDLKTDSIPPILKSKTSAENRTSDFPSAVEILAQTPLLFDGAVVISKNLEDREPLDVLCWCAYAYSQKDRMSGPGGVVRNRLLENQRPIEWTKHRWKETLPKDFLEALGLIQYECDVCNQIFEHHADLVIHKQAHPIFAICDRCSKKFETLDQLEQHYEKAHPEPNRLVPDQSVTMPIVEGINADQAWQMVLDQLQVEMPRASFDTWVRDAEAVRYDGNTLTIGVANPYAAEWLKNRQTAAVERLLSGILHTNIEVDFIVYMAVDAESI